MDRTRHVLDHLLAEILEPHLDLVGDLFAHRVGDANAGGWRHRLEPRRDVHAITEDVVVLDDDVAEMDADAELDASIVAHTNIVLGHRPLQVHGLAQRIDDAGELHQDAITGGLDEAPMVPFDARVHEPL